MVTSTERSKQWRLDNPERWKEHQRRYRAKVKAAKPPKQYVNPKVQDKKRRLLLKIRIHAHKISIGCSKCGYNKCGAALDWHHPYNNKDRRISVRSYFTKLGEEERAKCILLCANCHREEHEDQKIKENGDVY